VDSGDLLSVYARLEPTTDEVLIKYDPKRVLKKMDVQVYKDEECTIPFGRYTWWQDQPIQSDKTVVLNCYRWNLVWKEDLVAKTVQSS
jgi:hypothetical protein